MSRASRGGPFPRYTDGSVHHLAARRRTSRYISSSKPSRLQTTRRSSRVQLGSALAREVGRSSLSRKSPKIAAAVQSRSSLRTWKLRTGGVSVERMVIHPRLSCCWFAYHQNNRPPKTAFALGVGLTGIVAGHASSVDVCRKSRPGQTAAEPHTVRSPRRWTDSDCGRVGLALESCTENGPARSE